MLVPEGLLFTKDHEWVKIEAEDATIGITDYAQSSLGDITFVELPKIGIKLKQFGVCATVESVKAASDIYSPLSGEVVKINTKLNTNPELINKSPYEEGWLFVLKVEDLKEKELLMDAKKYQEYLGSKNSNH